MKWMKIMNKLSISLSQKNIYKISYESIRLMKFLCQKNYTANINYHDFMASVLYALIDS